IDELNMRLEMAKRMGGEEGVSRQHANGKLTVRERINALADPGSFKELSALAGSARYENNELVDFIPYPRVIGTSTINGLRVILDGGDFTVRGGAGVSGARRHGSRPGAAGPGGRVRNPEADYPGRPDLPTATRRSALRGAHRAEALRAGSRSADPHARIDGSCVAITAHDDGVLLRVSLLIFLGRTDDLRVAGPREVLRVCPRPVVLVNRVDRERRAVSTGSELVTRPGHVVAGVDLLVRWANDDPEGRTRLWGVADNRELDLVGGRGAHRQRLRLRLLRGLLLWFRGLAARQGGGHQYKPDPTTHTSFAMHCALLAELAIDDAVIVETFRRVCKEPARLTDCRLWPSSSQLRRSRTTSDSHRLDETAATAPIWKLLPLGYKAGDLVEPAVHHDHVPGIGAVDLVG
ncbi:MAG: hypothetical protein IIA03_02125, partial [Proteobacteria bacterium]|nr:hypothetical protein [Pseudomonadota bacterium]